MPSATEKMEVNDENAAVEKDEKMETNGNDEQADDGPDYNIQKHYPSAKKIDLGSSMVISGLPTAFFDDEFEVFSETLLGMLGEDFEVARKFIRCIVRLNKDASNEENGCRAMITFTERVCKHRIFASTKKLASSAMKVSHVEAIPEEVVALFGKTESEEEEEANEGGEDEVLEEDKNAENDEDGETKEAKEEGGAEESPEKKDKPEEKKKQKEWEDDHSSRPYTISWEGAPEFQWRLNDTINDARKLVIENAEPLDIYEPFLYRTSLKADQVLMKMPGRASDDQTSLGTLTLIFPTYHLVMQQAMLNLIYQRTSGNRRLKIYLPQTKQNLFRKKDFESRLGRKIDYTEQFYQLLIKADELSLEESTFTAEDASAAFDGKKIKSVERVEDANQKSCFVVTFECVHECIMAHANTRKVKIGDVQCGVYMIGPECNTDDGRPHKYLTRQEKNKALKEINERKRKEREEAIARGEAPPSKKARISGAAPNNNNGNKQAGIAPRRPNAAGVAPAAARGGIAAGRGRGGRGRGALPGRSVQPVFDYRTPSNKSIPAFNKNSGGSGGTRTFPSSGRNSFGGGGRGGDDRTPRGGSGGYGRPPTSGGYNNGGALRGGAFKSPDYRSRDLEPPRTRRSDQDLQDALYRQQQMINVMAERLRERDSAPLAAASSLYGSSSAFERPIGSAAAAYSSSPSVSAYNKAGGYSPSPAYEPLSSSYTPSHLTNNPVRPFDNVVRSPYGGTPSSDAYQSKSSYDSGSSSYRDRRY